MKTCIGLVFSIILSFSQAGAVTVSKDISWICPAKSPEILRACLDEKLSEIRSANCQLVDVTKDTPMEIGGSPFVVFKNKAENCSEARGPLREAKFQGFPVFINGTSI